jgi:hypothetical protein
MLLGNNLIADQSANTRPLSNGFCGQKGVEDLLSNRLWNPGAIIGNHDFNLWKKVNGQS